MGVILAEDGATCSRRTAASCSTRRAARSRRPLDLRCDLTSAARGPTCRPTSTSGRATSPPVTLVRGRADESRQANPGSGTWEWNNRDGRFSPKNPVSPYYGQLGRNTPVRWSVPAQQTTCGWRPTRRQLRLMPGRGRAAHHRRHRHPHRPEADRLAGERTWPGSGSAASRLQRAGCLGADGLLSVLLVDDGQRLQPSARRRCRCRRRAGSALRVTLAVSTGTVTFYTGPAGRRGRQHVDAARARRS